MTAASSGWPNMGWRLRGCERHGKAKSYRAVNHTAMKTDVLHRHYVGLNEADVAVAMLRIQEAMSKLMRDTRRQGVQECA
jgi:hypothetical protein